MKIEILLVLGCLLYGAHTYDWGFCWEIQRGDGSFCDCGCGGHWSTPLSDPDCGPFGSNPPVQPYPQSLTCQPLTWNRNLWCSPNGTCAPCIGCGVWTCARESYNDGSVCNCNCGMPDPDCNVDQSGAANCYSGEVCDATGACNRCGNGAVDSGETCDRKGGCCSSDCSTKLQDGIDCKGGTGSCSDGVCLVPAEIGTASTSHISSIKARLTWSMESGGTVEKFCIQKKEKLGVGDWTTWEDVYPGLTNWNVNGNGDFYKQIPDLEPDTTYRARVRNMVGTKTSDWESTTQFTTDP